HRDCKLCDAHRHTNFSERPLDGREDWNRCLHFNLGMPNRVVVADHLVQKTTPAQRADGPNDTATTTATAGLCSLPGWPAQLPVSGRPADVPTISYLDTAMSNL